MRLKRHTSRAIHVLLATGNTSTFCFRASHILISIIVHLPFYTTLVNYLSQLFKLSEKVSKMKKPCFKIGSVVLICVSVFIYLSWDMTPKAVLAIRTGDYIHLLHETNISTEKAQKVNTNEIQGEDYDLRIIVVVYNRAKSLLRLLDSLNKAEYDSDSVMLEVWIDRSEDQKIDSSTLQIANGFMFKHGQYSVIPHPQHVGIFGQWLTTWKPKLNSSEIAVILEDDLTVSPYFYKYLKLVHRRYDNYPEINGYALHGSSIKHSVKDRSILQGPRDNLVFLYPVIGTWGFSPNKRNWIKFLDWFAVAKSDKNYQPYVPGNIVTDWYKEFKQKGKVHTMWSIWHIHYAWKNKEFTLYSNFEGHAGLTTNWQEKGLHYQQNENKATNKLLTEWKPEYEQLPEKLVHLDITGKVIPS